MLSTAPAAIAESHGEQMSMISPGLMIPPMDPAKGKLLFASKDCVVCHSINGVWLLAAPLVFWTPDAAVYANDSLIGALLVALTILIPMMPGMSREGMMDDTDIPPGWTYCPSTYVQRLPIIALGVVGFILSRILSAYQLGHIDGVWEPFFSSPVAMNGTEYIITSDVSKAWRIADGGLGTMSYMF